MGEKATGWTHWSTNEKVAAVILLSVLAIFVILLGLIVYEPPTGPGLCGAIGPQPCPGREDLNIITAAVNSPTSMTIQILNTGETTSSHSRSKPPRSRATVEWFLSSYPFVKARQIMIDNAICN